MILIPVRIWLCYVRYNILLGVSFNNTSAGSLYNEWVNSVTRYKQGKCSDKLLCSEQLHLLAKYHVEHPLSYL